uniref:hypothetical protein n=1 Tax=Prevotella sp. TaxID=59823 RepID=UPI004027F5FC
MKIRNTIAKKQDSLLHKKQAGDNATTAFVSSLFAFYITTIRWLSDYRSVGTSLPHS